MISLRVSMGNEICFECMFAFSLSIIFLLLYITVSSMQPQRNCLYCCVLCAHVVQVSACLEFNILTICVPIKSRLQNLCDNSWVKPRLRHGSGNPNNCYSVPPPSHSGFVCLFPSVCHCTDWSSVIYIYGNDMSCCLDKCNRKSVIPIRENLFWNV